MTTKGSGTNENNELVLKSEQVTNSDDKYLGPVDCEIEKTEQNINQSIQTQEGMY